MGRNDERKLEGRGESHRKTEMERKIKQEGKK